MPEHEIFAAKASTFKQQDAKSWLNIIKSRSYSLSRHTMISCYSSRVESDAMRDAFFPQKLQESRDYYLTFVILGKFRTFISHWLEKINATTPNWFQMHSVWKLM